MAIHRPAVSVTEARRLSQERLEGPNVTQLHIPAPTEEVTSTVSNVSDRELEVNAKKGRERQAGPSLRQKEEFKTQVFLSAPLPAPGVSSSFDTLSRNYRATKALQMILRHALDDYEALLSRGAPSKRVCTYETADPPVFVSTSRMMPDHLLETAFRHLDPLGFESARAIGRKLATSALALFFEAESRRQSERGIDRESKTANN